MYVIIIHDKISERGKNTPNTHQQVLTCILTRMNHHHHQNRRTHHSHCSHYCFHRHRRHCCCCLCQDITKAYNQTDVEKKPTNQTISNIILFNSLLFLISRLLFAWQVMKNRLEEKLNIESKNTLTHTNNSVTIG